MIELSGIPMSVHWATMRRSPGGGNGQSQSSAFPDMSSSPPLPPLGRYSKTGPSGSWSRGLCPYIARDELLAFVPSGNWIPSRRMELAEIPHSRPCGTCRWKTELISVHSWSSWLARRRTQFKSMTHPVEWTLTASMAITKAGDLWTNRPTGTMAGGSQRGGGVHGGGGEFGFRGGGGGGGVGIEKARKKVTVIPTGFDGCDRPAEQRGAPFWTPQSVLPRPV